MTAANMSEPAKVKNVLFLGDNSVGISAILHAFASRPFTSTPTELTLYDCVHTKVKLNNVSYSVGLHHVNGSNDSVKFREYIYDIVKADCFILCYSIDNRDSFTSLANSWIQEIRAKNKPIILLGTKCDITEGNLVNFEEADEFKKSISAVEFLQCSSKSSENIAVLKSIITKTLYTEGLSPPVLRRHKTPSFRRLISSMYSRR